MQLALLPADNWEVLIEFTGTRIILDIGLLNFRLGQSWYTTRLNWILDVAAVSDRLCWDHVDLLASEALQRTFRRRIRYENSHHWEHDDLLPVPSTRPRAREEKAP